MRCVVRSRSPGEISRVENVAEEFFQLSVPRSSEILDVAAGSGIVSALLQTGGYVNIDALVTSMLIDKYYTFLLLCKILILLHDQQYITINKLFNFRPIEKDPEQ